MRVQGARENNLEDVSVALPERRRTLDWIVDLGPGAGHEGGRIVFEGTPTTLVAARSTPTGEHLAAFVGA